MSGPGGLPGLLKDGYKHLSGVEEAVIKNIEAGKQLSQITRTSVGPHGMNKMVINHLDRLFVTSDAATILQEMEVQHPAAKMLAMAATTMEGELGDGTNLVVSLAGELLAQAEDLIRQGLHPSEIVEGYKKAADKAIELLPSYKLDFKVDIRDVNSVAKALKGVIASKQYGYEDVIAPLIAKACSDVCPDNGNNFNVDNVRVCKVAGGGLAKSSVVSGMLLKRGVEGTVTHLSDVKCVVYGQAVDTVCTETKGTVLITNAAQLESYSKSEEDKMEEYIKGIADAGAKVVVGGGTFGEMALHFIERYGLMAIKITSKFEMRRFCRATGALGLVKNEPPTPDQLGYIKDISVQEIGDTIVTVVKQDDKVGKLATILLRASTDNILDELERAVDDGVNTFKTLARDCAVLPAGGATECALSHGLTEFGKTITGLDQYAVGKFAKALMVVPRVLCENAGINPEEALPMLNAAHAGGNFKAGINVEELGVIDLHEQDIVDVFEVKNWAIRLAADAAITVLRVDQIIMAKQAGGPKSRGPGGDEE
mmetsp:Transcript_33051/g.39988  ORF Transcript_33051/g.39988 Transcript_33051/m.39988 type:complete len:539 (-) Transcript_33051:207-1823(-)|eukprot:CAMPEP_0197854002 /NCGR_PEP_ID=MMETSP1438-20131217/23857_1 /TAXON_ID=1461541 /ORGANISM="Pterosperma sp., Strain CCMP1384" /LENGTH=538 /DNA_ID=CAMNT_0043468605 /DNA_START=167 /DNA_END=1783 /DNA_ORIENTATION=+